MDYNPVGSFISDNLISSDRPPVLSVAEAQAIEMSDIEHALSTVVDPEIPVLSARELGVLRDVEWQGDTLVTTITPTYSGCPAMGHFEDDIRVCLEKLGIPKIKVNTRLSPAWTSDWLSDDAKQKLRDYGIAPPMETTSSLKVLLGHAPEVSCPKCHSTEVREVSRHGSTACKALYQCDSCQEPFDYFKCI
ncbi:1,2-phenylacetyl-CoA epoxidase subunit PaaD [Pseudoteredinibacter isoporae]|uniref:Ring-1,2-phenylacetyl-CoA epoxidase subunit PaaD n=1 Tax=Pseudoteredinibacter isoporae TaxID=570281 RepID=A0A7X0MXC0_9GAMM|nr:1,2-phenylacetyl-CoA epoxidase subunit PaaD [Pseudoteredinibacter isoporae]MBB6523561.1 ring-1,2-phenylacetyl-CoA epoxidase subunit PaaD [Pseudoteredinibacter isoporae]